jgi:pyruvate dehydrogenase (quinone)
MSQPVGDHLLDRLSTWGVQRVYGYPGDGINGLMGAFERADDGTAPEFVQVRHEEMAAFMACAHAKFTGRLGVCMATSGPGAIHLLNGMYDAKLDHQPVVAIVGQQARAGLGGNYQQEVDLASLFKDVAHEYVQMAYEPAQVRHLVDRACRIALAERTVTAIIVPNDLQGLMRSRRLRTSMGPCTPAPVTTRRGSFLPTTSSTAGRRSSTRASGWRC